MWCDGEALACYAPYSDNAAQPVYSLPDGKSYRKAGAWPACSAASSLAGGFHPFAPFLASVLYWYVEPFPAR